MQNQRTSDGVRGRPVLNHDSAAHRGISRAAYAVSAGSERRNVTLADLKEISF